MTGHRRSTWKVLGRAVGLYAVAVLFLMLPPLGAPLADNPGLLFWLWPAVLLAAFFLNSADTRAGSGGWDADGNGGDGGGGGNGGGDGGA